MVVSVVGCFETDFARGEVAGALDVGVDLEVEAAFKLGALSGELLGIE